MKSLKPQIESLEKYSPPLDERKDKIRLDFNENAFGCSPKVIGALRNINSKDISIYPTYKEAKKELAKFLGVDSSEIILTNGADEAIRTIITTFMDNQEVILPVPTFPIFKISASIVGSKIKEIPYNKDLSFPTDRVLENITKETGMIILVNPNNPTGTIIKEQDIVEILEKSGEIIVVIDEAYYEYYGKTAKELIEKYENLIIIRTFSKAFGLAGLRLGYIISNNQVISLLEKVISPYSVNNLALIAMKSSLEDTNFMQENVKAVKQNRDYIQKELTNLGIKSFNSEANFLLTNFDDKSELVYNHLKENGILVRNVGKYPLLKGCLRITIGTREQCDKLINEIKSLGIKT